MRKIITITLFLITLLLSQSCENMIEIDLPTDQVNSESVFKDKRSATSALTNLYINLRDSSIFSGNSQGLGTYLGLYTDELEPPSTSPTADSFLLYKNSLDPTKYVLESIWNTSYANIYAINSFINGVTKSTEISKEDKEQLLDKAYILRAMYYQALTQTFGDIPYTTTTDYKSNTTIKKISPFEVFKNAEQDLLKSMETLSYTDNSPNKYYPNKAVAELILAKNYLLQKKYDKAEYYAKLVINNPLYHLEADLSKVFKNTAKSTIWQLSNVVNTVPTHEAKNYILFTNYLTIKLSKSLLNNLEDNDLRKHQWIKKHDNTGQFYAYKYKNRTNNTDECSVLFRYAPEQVHLVRSNYSSTLSRISFL